MGSDEAPDMKTRLTQIAVPEPLKARIETLARIDHRGYRGEILALLEIGAAARERQISK